MNTPTVLQQWSRDRLDLVTALAPRTLMIAPGKHRSLSGMRWRADLVVTAAQPLEGTAEARVMSNAAETRASVIAGDVATDVAVLRIEADHVSEPAIADEVALQA